MEKAIESFASSDELEEYDWSRSVIQPRFYFRTNRRRDRDNFAAQLKGAYDGVAEGMGVDDQNFMPMPPIFDIDKKDPRLELVVTAKLI